MNLSCTVCRELFGEWDGVECDDCARTVHRYTCGYYEMFDEEGERLAFFFCKTCMEIEEN